MAVTIEDNNRRNPMTSIDLTLEPILSMTDEGFLQLCRANPEAKLELTATGKTVLPRFILDLTGIF